MDIEELRETQQEIQSHMNMKKLNLPVDLPIDDQREVDKINGWLEAESNYTNLVSDFNFEYFRCLHKKSNIYI